MIPKTEKWTDDLSDKYLVKTMEDDGSAQVYNIVKAPNHIPVLNGKIIGEVVDQYRFPTIKKHGSPNNNNRT